MSTVLGIFIGGRGLRMGGVQKALLIAPDTGETLIARSLRIGREAGLEVVLLGAAELGAHAVGALQLPDASAGIGPLAGLQSLLTHAGERSAICLACDMPYVTTDLLSRFVNATARPTSKQAQVLAPRDPVTGKWEPLFARYQSPTVAPVLATTLAEGERSFQGLFRRLTVAELPLDPSERAQLRDWDRPEDMRIEE